MSRNEFAAPIRSEMAAQLRAMRRATRDLRVALDYDGIAVGKITAEFAGQIATIREFVRGIEDVTGFPILSNSRARERRDGVNVY